MASCPHCNELYIGFHRCNNPGGKGGSRCDKCGKFEVGIHVCSK